MNEQKFYYHSISGRLLGSLAREERISQILEKIKPIESFLEVGCAEGHYLAKIERKVRVVVGMDFEEEKTENAKKNCKKAKILQANAEKLPFKDNCFDFVLCSEVIEHLPNWKKGLQELKRVSRKKILITIPLEKGYFWKTVSVFAPMSTRKHLHALESNDILKEMQGWKLLEKNNIATPSRRVNKKIGYELGETKGMYSLLFLEKK